jgi:hypothetical protein
MFCRSLFVLLSFVFWPLCCLSFDFRLLIAHWYLHTLAIVLSVLWFSTSDCQLVSSHFWPLCCLFFDLRLLIANWYLHTFGHCIICPLIFDFWLPIGIFRHFFSVCVIFLFIYLFIFLKWMGFSWYSVKVPLNTINPNSLIHMYICFHWHKWFTCDFVSM